MNHEFTPHQLALMLLDAVRQFDISYLMAVLKHIHNFCVDSDLRWIFRTAKLDLTPDQQLWLKESLATQEA